MLIDSQYLDTISAARDDDVLLSVAHENVVWYGARHILFVQCCLVFEASRSVASWLQINKQQISTIV